MRIALPIATCLLLTTPAALAQQPAAPKLDNYGDPLPPGAVVRLGTNHLAASGGFTWLPDGKTLVAARHGKLLFWDVTTGRLTKELVTPIVVPEGMSFRYYLDCSADGKKLVCAGRSGQFCVCDLETGNFVSSPVPAPRSGYRLESVAMDPQGTCVAAVDHATGNFDLWDSATCVLNRKYALRTRYDGTIAPAFSADGKMVVVAASRGGHVMLAPVDGSGPPVEIADVHNLRVHSLNLTEDGARLISAGAGEPQNEKDTLWKTGPPQIRIWDVATKKMIRELPIPPGLRGGCLASLAADDKTLISVHSDRTLVWDLTSDLPPRALEAWRFPTSRTKIRVDPRGKYVAAAHMSKPFVGIWDLATGKSLLSPESRHSSYVTAAAFSRDGRTIATGGADNEVRLWNAQTGEHLRTIRHATGWIRGLVFHDDDRRLLVSAESPLPETDEYRGTLFGFDPATGELLFESDLPERGALLSLSPTGKLLAVVTRNVGVEGPIATKLRIFDPLSGKKVADVPGPGFEEFASSASAFHWSEDGRSLLVSCEDNAVRRIDVKTGKVLQQFAVPHLTTNPFNGEPLGASVQVAAFTSADRIVTGSRYGIELIGWNLGTGDKLWTIQAPQTSVRQLAASPDGRILACTSSIGRDPCYTHLTLWDVASQRQLGDVDLGQEDSYAMTFSHDGKRLLLGFTDGTALVYDVSDLR